MKILVIQTIRKEVEIMIYDTEKKLSLNLIKWISERNELEVLIKNIDKLLNEKVKLRDLESGLRMMKRQNTKLESDMPNSLSFADYIDGILVFVGIGAFSATRIGVTVANVLSNFGNKKLWEAFISDPDLELTWNLEMFVKNYFDEAEIPNNPKEVKIAVPKYKTKPNITLSKKFIAK